MSLSNLTIALQGIGASQDQTAVHGLLDTAGSALVFTSDTTDGADISAASVNVQGVLVFSSATTDGADVVSAYVSTGTSAAGGYGSKRYIVRVGKKLVEFASEAEAAAALDAQQPEQVKAVAVKSVDMKAVKKLAQDRLALDVFQQQLQQMQLEALMRSYEAWQDDQDIEDLVALL